LKFGAYIVDALRKYKQPVLVYIPPHAELRGGAWVVVDPTINERHMELYADEESRGGVLEPEGTVTIKFRRKELVKAMKRCDEEYNTISKKLAADDLPAADRKTLEKNLKLREELLEPIYHQVAVNFADLHDTPGCLHAKECVSGVLQWKTSRSYLYWRLRRLLLQCDVRKRCFGVDNELTHARVDAMLRRWFVQDQGSVKAHLWEENKFAVNWLREQLSTKQSLLEENIKALQRDAITQQIKDLTLDDPEICMHSITHLARSMDDEQRKQVIQLLQTNKSVGPSSSEQEHPESMES